MDNNQFDPDAPLDLDGQGAEKKKIGVRRVNNMPLIIVCGVVVVFVILVAMVAMDRAAKVHTHAGNDTEGQIDKGLADQVLGPSGGRTGGLVGVQEDTSLPIAKVDNLDLPPPPPVEKEDPDLAKLYAAKLALFQKAVSAGSLVAENASKNQSQTTPAGMGSNSGVVQGASRDGRRLDSGDEAAQGKEGDYKKYEKPNDKDRWLLGESLEAPRSRYELRAGFVIPGIMLSGVNSELPGQIIAQVSQDVYDTPTGKYKWCMANRAC
jgi:type IV secretory pathway VirB10-like protein